MQPPRLSSVTSQSSMRSNGRSRTTSNETPRAGPLLCLAIAARYTYDDDTIHLWHVQLIREGNG